jgi:hypothetical protein
MEHEFTVNRRRYRGTRERVIEALRDVPPEPATPHTVEIEGLTYPVKQALSVVFGIDRADFITPTARRVFQRLGFSVSGPTVARPRRGEGGRPPGKRPARTIDTRDEPEVQVFDIPTIMLKWSQWERWDDVAELPEGDEGIHIPTGPGVYEVLVESQRGRLVIGKTANLRDRVRQGLVRGTSPHPAGQKVRENQDTSDLVVRWAVTDCPAAAEEELHKRHIAEFGRLPKYTGHT